MDPTIRKLPKNVQSLICASNQINSYTKAVQELVFNALDADATSIAVRTNISEGSIQVVDNGSGITQADFNSIGQNYMTSKLVDISSLKSAPNKYGFQGQSLANLAQISKTLKVTSRFYKCETARVKVFYNGEAKSTVKCISRPSKGTTIEIKGFLYNLSIRKNSVDSLSELQGIKTFLEHISIVHTSISLSLRNDSKNEIMYKIHKNRDIYQTLSTLYEIEKSNVQELQVEKNQYKIKAYVGKRDVETNRQLIFLNGKFISDTSLLHKKVNENFKKHLKLGKNIIKKNMNNDNENLIFRNKIPFYFIFITCPYMDYELTNTILEFKDGDQINIILDKLVKFYIGDIQLQVVPKNKITRCTSKPETENTRNQIEKIMQKILGNHSKKPIISQMQRGVKGKLIKRKPKCKKNLLKVNSKKNNVQKISKQGFNDILINEQNSNTNDSISKIRPSLKNYKTRKEETSEHTGFTKKSVEKHTKSKLSKQLKPKSKLVKIPLHNNYKVSTEQNDKQCLKKLSLNNKFAMETESVKRRCELLAQKTKELIENNKKNAEIFINKNVHITRSNFVNNKKNIAVHKKVKETIIHKYIPKSKLNISNKNENNCKNKLFKTNYDLLQTIISSQIENNESRELNVHNYSIEDVTELGPNFIPDKKRDGLLPSFETKPANRYCVPLVKEPNDPTPIQSKIPDYNIMRESGNMPSLKRITPNISSRSFFRELGGVSPFQVEKQCKDIDNHIPLHGDTLKHSSRYFDRKSGGISLLRSATYESNIEPYLIRTSDDASPFQIQVTFQSHNYVQQAFEADVELPNLCKKPRFITTRSRENFINFPENNRIKKNKPNRYSKAIQSNNRKRKLDKSMKMFDIENNMVKGIRETYTVEFTESKEYNSSMNVPIKNNCGSIEAITPSIQASSMFDDLHYQCVSPTDPKTWLISKYNSKFRELDYEPTNGNNTFATNSYLCDNTFENNNGTYTIDSKNKSCNTNEKSKMIRCSPTNTNNNGTCFVFVSQENDDEIQIINPIDLCETVLENPEISIKRTGEILCFDINQGSSNNLSMNSNDANKMGDTLNEFNLDKNIFNIPSNYSYEKNEPNDPIKFQNLEEFKETSHNFLITNSIISTKQTPTLIQKHDPNSKARYNAENITLNKQDPNEQNKNASIVTEVINNTRAFHIRNRMFFVPKGMSPIFEECQTNLASICDSREDYYTDKIYNDFVDKVQNNTMIFKPKIQDTSDLATKDISKVNSKLKKNNASLKFDGLCIKKANVLGQVDFKFIAAIMKSKSHKSDDLEEFLVLFDQHAVHERIRLEKNLADYLIGSQWKSVTIDEVTLKMSRDDILYLHNYRYKFKQFGLQWDILNYNEISLTAIPEGILGKNPRQVEKIIKAVKNLITEEINIIQTQRGCVALYPKSLMDLVFSEACRYAIKFGDHLSKTQCIRLLNELSDCKTPYQCAHGRPAMAVIMNIESNQANYKIDFKKLKHIKENIIGVST